MKLLLAFVVTGVLLLCAAYSILAYYRLVSIAKGIEPYGWIRSRSLFDPEAEFSISEGFEHFAFGGRPRRPDFLTCPIQSAKAVVSDLTKPN
jgi:hypothetical protein